MKPLLMILSALLLCGCESHRYHQILVIDAKSYRHSMEWADLRGASFGIPYIMQIDDADGQPIPLFRFKHDSSGFLPLDESTVHLSTPIIMEKRHTNFVLTIRERQGKELKKLRVDVGKLDAVQGRSSARVLPVELK